MDFDPYNSLYYTSPSFTTNSADYYDNHVLDKQPPYMQNNNLVCPDKKERGELHHLIQQITSHMHPYNLGHIS